MREGKEVNSQEEGVVPSPEEGGEVLSPRQREGKEVRFPFPEEGGE